MSEGKLSRRGEVLTDTAVALVLLKLGPLASVVQPAVSAATQQALERVRAVLDRKASKVAEHAAAEAIRRRPELDEGAVAAALTGDPGLLGLAMRVIDAATRTGNEDKLTWLGTLLGDAIVERGDRIDTWSILVQALDDLEAPHAVVLEKLDQPPPHVPKKPLNAWMPHELAEVVGDEGLARACTMTLVRHGLASDHRGAFAPESYGITNHGRALLVAMRAAAGRPPINPTSIPTRPPDDAQPLSDN